ncbi:MAG: hypothetical protein HZB26_13850 [Candidatus Hydrogenedentes bacterium]|nr:hypothetical protein [Candidatus Hydrogenedentota bacterium]
MELKAYRFFGRRIAIGALVILGSMWSGCTGPAPSITSPSPKDSAQPPVPGRIVALPSFPIVRVNEPVSGDNQVQNGGFETALGGAPVAWALSIPEGGTAARSDEFYTEGSHCLRASVPADAPFEAVEELPVIPRKTYLVRAMVLTKDASGRGRIEVRDPEGKAEGFPVRSEGVTGTIDAWSLQTLRFTVPASAKKLVISLAYTPGAGANTSAAIWFDQCELHQLDPKNYLAHATFEDADATGYVSTWWPNNDPSIGISRDAYEGTKAKEIRPVEGKDSYLAACAADAAELLGKTIRVRVMVKAARKDPSGPTPVVMKLACKVAAKEHAVQTEHPGNGQWTELVLEDTVPKDADPTSKSFQLLFLRQSNADGPVLVDDAIMELLPSP